MGFNQPTSAAGGAPIWTTPTAPVATGETPELMEEEPEDWGGRGATPWVLAEPGEVPTEGEGRWLVDGPGLALLLLLCPTVPPTTPPTTAPMTMIAAISMKILHFP
jgi:hypothetical protein